MLNQIQDSKFFTHLQLTNHPKKISGVVERKEVLSTISRILAARKHLSSEQSVSENLRKKAVRIASAKELLVDKTLTNVGIDIEEQIGSGSQAIVYAATKRIWNDSRLAVKLTKNTRDPFSTFILKKGEPTLLYINPNPFTPTLHGMVLVDAEGAYHFLTKSQLINADLKYKKIACTITDFIEGSTLLDVLVKNPERVHTIQQIQRIARQLSLAVETIHSKGIVFRDLKPENILINQSGHVKIVDFGFAKKIDSGHTYTDCGSSQWVAPEVILAKSEENNGYTTQSDLWGLGLVLYALDQKNLPPWSSDNPQENLDHISKFNKKNKNNPVRYTFGRYSGWNKEANTNPDLIDLVNNLVCAPEHRLKSASDALNHRFFNTDTRQ